MRQFIATVFDDHVFATQAVETPSLFDAMLALPDEIIVQALVRRVSGASPTFSLLLDRSNDSRMWDEGEILLSGVPLVAGSTNRFWAASRIVTGGFARLRIQLGGTGPRANVELVVCGRDVGARSRSVDRSRRIGLGFSYVRPRFLPDVDEGRASLTLWPSGRAVPLALDRGDAVKPEVNRVPAFWSSPDPDDPNLGKYVR